MCLVRNEPVYDFFLMQYLIMRLLEKLTRSGKYFLIRKFFWCPETKSNLHSDHPSSQKDLAKVAARMPEIPSLSPCLSLSRRALHLFRRRRYSEFNECEEGTLECEYDYDSQFAILRSPFCGMQVQVRVECGSKFVPSLNCWSHRMHTPRQRRHRCPEESEIIIVNL